MADCPNCEYHKQRAQIWRDEAYKLSGHPLPEREPVLEEREACAKLVEDSWMAFSRTPNRRLDITPFPELEYVAKVIRARGQA